MINLSERKRPIGELVEQYRTRDDVHNVFGVILYTASHPFVIKMLRDDDFWNALNEISGPRWPIFAIRPEQGYVTRRLPRVPDGVRTFMVPVEKWHEPPTNRELLQAFNIKDTSKLPLFLVFAEGRKGEALQLSFRIQDADQDACFLSLKNAIGNCADAISNVTDENIKNTEAVFGRMGAVHYQGMVVKCFKIGVSFVQWAKSILWK